MKKIITLLCLLIVSVLFIPKTKAWAPKPLVQDLSPQEVISYYAELYGADEKTLLSMARCESQFKPSAHNEDDGGSPSTGLYQYKKGTFERYSQLMGEELNMQSYHDQAKLTAWVYVHYPKERKAWTSYRAIVNGGSYTFTFEGEPYTVYCK